MRLQRLAIALLLLVSTGGAMSRASAQADAAAKARARSYEDYLIYAMIFQRTRNAAQDDQAPLKTLVESVYPRAIREYQEFVRERPASSFADDAKLRIAEFYNLCGPKSGDKEMFPDIAFDERWREEAKPWLTDIVEHHPNDKRFDLIAVKELDEPTAALALYYLGAWFGERKYFDLLLQRYPKSGPAAWVHLPPAKEKLFTIVPVKPNR